jgi:hypothetical protein
MSAARGTYAYCIVASAVRPRIARKAAGLPGTGPVRLLDIERGLYVVVADVPLDRYGEEAISRGLGDLEWVSRAAMAHEAVVESFIDASAVLPMKLFTIFTSDERAVAHVRGERRRIAAAAKRVANHHEWGVRVVFDATHPAGANRGTGIAATRAAGDGKPSGIAYLTRKKAQRDAGVERAERARATVAALYDTLAARATLARRKAPGEFPVQGGPLLLDAAFLVPRARAKSFETLAARQAASLARHGYGLTLTGPWPPYSFVEE